MNEDERLVNPDNVERGDNALRPTSLGEFIGQGNGRHNLETFILMHGLKSMPTKNG